MARSIFLLLALVVSAGASLIFHADHEQKLDYLNIIKEVNSKEASWKAGVPFRFENATIADVKRLLGTVLPSEAGYEAPEVRLIFLLCDLLSIYISFTLFSFLTRLPSPSTPFLTRYPHSTLLPILDISVRA